jgi:hypothetical protein
LVLVLFQTQVVGDCSFRAACNKGYQYIGSCEDSKLPEFEVENFVETQTAVVQLVVAEIVARTVSLVVVRIVVGQMAVVGGIALLAAALPVVGMAVGEIEMLALLSHLWSMAQIVLVELVELQDGDEVHNHTIATPKIKEI